MNPRRIHLAACDHCGRRIAWSRRRRQWLVLHPYTWMTGTQLQRRLRCPASRGYHDPAGNLGVIAERTFARLRGGAAA